MKTKRLLLIAASERELVVTDSDVHAVACGIGPVEAALTTTAELAAASYAAVLHVGIAGAQTLTPGAVVIGSEALYCDVMDPNATLPRVERVLARRR